VQKLAAASDEPELTLDWSDAARRYYLRPAAPFVRGTLGAAATASLADDEVVALGLAQGVRLHRFKRAAPLPRVQRVLGILRGVDPESLLDVGSGRGAFLWPLLDAFPDLAVTAIDREAQHVRVFQAVREGGLATLDGRVMDAAALELPDRCVDCVTALEVLEHLHAPPRAVDELVRVARRFVVASVPSRPDNNPEHVQLFTGATLSALFERAGAARVNVEYVHNHMILVARLH
jgi:SAM-dependent methyltransferase